MSWQPILLCRQGFPNVHQKQLNPLLLPPETGSKRLPRQPRQPFHADVPQDVAAFLESSLLRPWTDWALSLPDINLFESCVSNLSLDMTDS